MELFFISIILLTIAFAGISIKIIFKKDGKFSGTCASNNPFLNKEGKPCSLCGKLPEENDCKKSNFNLNWYKYSQSVLKTVSPQDQY